MWSQVLPPTGWRKDAADLGLKALQQHDFESAYPHAVLRPHNYPAHLLSLTAAAY